MTRNHIHCAVGLSGDKAVTSGRSRVFEQSARIALTSPALCIGMRTTANLFIYLDVAAMLAGSSSRLSCSVFDFRSYAHSHASTDSIKIYASTNNVLLTSGVDGVLPPKYFKQVMHRVKGGELEELPLESTEA